MRNVKRFSVALFVLFTLFLGGEICDEDTKWRNDAHAQQEGPEVTALSFACNNVVLSIPEYADTHYTVTAHIIGQNTRTQRNVQLRQSDNGVYSNYGNWSKLAPKDTYTIRHLSVLNGVYVGASIDSPSITCPMYKLFLPKVGR